MIKLKDIINEAIPKLPRINMGFGEAQNYAKMMIKKSNDIIKHTRAGNMGKSQKIINGNQTRDLYSMMGFTKAYNTAKKSCA